MHAVEQQYEPEAATQSNECAEEGFAPEIDQDVQNRIPCATRRDHADGGDGEEHGHRIVDARFQFEQRADTRTQLQAAAAQQEEDGCRIGGSHDGADQETLLRAERERPCAERPGEACGDENAHGCQHRCRGDRGADVEKARTQTAIEQDDRKRQRSDQISEAVIGETDPARAIFSGQHAHGEEHQQDGRAEARGDQAGEYACHDEARAEQERGVGKSNRFHVTENLDDGLPFSEAKSSADVQMLAKDRGFSAAFGIWRVSQ